VPSMELLDPRFCGAWAKAATLCGAAQTHPWAVLLRAGSWRGWKD